MLGVVEGAVEGIVLGTVEGIVLGRVVGLVLGLFPKQEQSFTGPSISHLGRGWASDNVNELLRLLTWLGDVEGAFDGPEVGKVEGLVLGTWGNR